jgi:hypothetical protein
MGQQRVGGGVVLVLDFDEPLTRMGVDAVSSYQARDVGR